MIAPLVWTTAACFAIYVALLGWGDLVRVGLGLRGMAGGGVSAALGMSFLCVLGGVLNLFGLISSFLAIVLLGVGWLMVAVGRIRARAESVQPPVAGDEGSRVDGVAAAILVLVAVFALFHVVSEAARPLNGHDDHQGYLIFPVRMLETGSAGDDPFNERRMGAWGGQSFLQAVMLSLVAPENLGALDGGVGWLVFTGLVWTHVRLQRLTLRAGGLLLLLWQLYLPEAVNLSSMVTGLALFYALALVLADDSARRGWRGVVASAIVVSALCSLKNSLVGGVVLIAAAVVLGDDRDPLPWRWARLSGIAMVGAMLAIPWMVSMYSSSGTILYPLLGRGVHGYGVPWTLAPPMSASLTDVMSSSYLAETGRRILQMPSIVPALLMFAVGGGLVASEPRQRLAGRMFAAGLVTTIITVVGTLGPVRYAYPFAFASFTFLCVETLASRRGWKGMAPEQAWSTSPARTRWQPWLVLGVFALLVVSTTLASMTEAWRDIRAFRPVDDSAAELQSVRAAQKVVPVGEPLLSVLAYPYALDFRRNPVFVVDHAGSASPAPGMPLGNGAGAVSRYLEGVGVRYVAYSYKDEAVYGPTYVGDRLTFGGSPYQDRLRLLARNNIAFRKQILDLAWEDAPAFDDGYVMVLHLAAEP